MRMATAETLPFGYTFTFRGQTKVVSFVRTYTQTGIDMVRIFCQDGTIVVRVAGTLL